MDEITMGNTIAAIVPMRHHSERVPGKNYRPFNGRPLYHYIVETLLACPLVTQVVIDTDSRIILDEAEAIFPQVRLITRPKHLRADTTPTNDVLINDVSQLDADF